MIRTPVQEAQRQLTLAETSYKKLLDKNRVAEAKYREKIGYLEDRFEALKKAETK